MKKYYIGLDYNDKCAPMYVFETDILSEAIAYGLNNKPQGDRWLYITKKLENGFIRFSKVCRI